MRRLCALLLLALPWAVASVPAPLAPSLKSLRRAKVLEARRPAHDGPNCWNAAMYLGRQVASVRFASRDEFHQTMAGLCAPLPDDVPRRPRDIVALRRAGGRGVDDEVHAAVFVAPGWVFDKPGLARDGAYVLRRESEFKAAYGAGLRADTFRCKTLGAYARENPLPGFAALWRDFDEVDLAVGHAAVNGVLPGAEAVAAARRALRELDALAPLAASAGPAAFELSLLRARSVSLRRQLEHLPAQRPLLAALTEMDARIDAGTLAQR